MRRGYRLGQHNGSDGLLIVGDCLVSDGVRVRQYVGDVWLTWDVLWLWVPAILRFKLHTEISLIGVFSWKDDGDESLVAQAVLFPVATEQ